MILRNLLHEEKLIKISNFSSALTLQLFNYSRTLNHQNLCLLSPRQFHSLLDFLAFEFHLLLTMPVISSLFVASYLFCRASSRYQPSRIIFTITLPPLLTICQFLYLRLDYKQIATILMVCFITIESKCASPLINGILNRKHM